MVKISAELPTHMKAVVLKHYDGTPQSLAAADFSVPRLRSGQVLIKLAATVAIEDQITGVHDLPGKPLAVAARSKHRWDAR